MLKAQVNGKAAMEQMLLEDKMQITETLLSVVQHTHLIWFPSVIWASSLQAKYCLTWNLHSLWGSQFSVAECLLHWDNWSFYLENW